MSRFTGKVVAVTGAAGGIGAATARCLASEGAALIHLPAWIIATSTAPIPNAGLAMDAAKPTATTKQNVPSAASCKRGADTTVFGARDGCDGVERPANSCGAIVMDFDPFGYAARCR